MNRHWVYMIFSILIVQSCQEETYAFKVSICQYTQYQKDKWITKEIVKDTIINSTVDIYTIQSLIKTPYYLPTNGFFKDSVKNRECDMGIYPQNVKCYEYDSLDRVTVMNISGSGVVNEFHYKYDNENNVSIIRDISGEYKINYNYRTGNIKSLSYESDIKKEEILIEYKFFKI